MTLGAKSIRLLLPALLVLATLMGCQRRESMEPIRLQGETQGTYYAVTYFDSLNRNFLPQIDSILHAIDISVSVYNKESLISRLNNNETDSVDLIFTENLRIASEVSEASGGAFDCTIGRLIEAWGWGFSKRNEIIPALIDSLRNIAGYNRVTIQNGRLVKEDPAIMINFNAIAQGYTSDLIARFLHAQGIRHFLVDVGGELVASGTKPGGVLWTIGIELPTEDNTVPEDLNERPTRAVLTITDKGVATSGNYRKFYVENGVKYSHTIDPSTGYPVKHSLLSATVVACNATMADAWATAFMVMGLDKAIVMLEKHPELQAYFIYSDEAGNDRTWISEGLKASITE
jgi:FAD:protein FMN transferase